MTSTRPRLVILKGAVTLEPNQLQALKSAFDVVEVHTPAAARKLLDGSVGGVVLCAPGDYLTLGGESLPAAAAILDRIGEGIGVIDASGAVLWTDARFKVYDDHIRSEFIRQCRLALEQFNQPADQANSIQPPAARRQPKRLTFAGGESFYELVVSPASIDQAQDKVMIVVGVMWEVTEARRLQARLAALETAGADLLEMKSAATARMSMADRLKMLEQKIIRAVHDLLGFDNFEVRLLDRQTGQLELVIARNISPLKIGEIIRAQAEGNGISGYVAATGRSYMCGNVQQDPLYREGLDRAASSLTVPLMSREGVVGTFNIESCTPNAFSDSDRQLAELFGRYIAAAMNVLDLLVAERYTTNEQASQNIVGELNQPLADLAEQVKNLQSARPDDEPLQRSTQDILDTVTRVRSRLECCTAGPRTVLGAEQELRNETPDPILAGKSVLVADDEPAIRDTLCSILTQKGARVTVCTSGSQTIDALNAARQRGERFDLVVSDIKMPDRNGYEVYRLSKELNPDTPVVLMTGFGYDPHHCIVRASQEGLQSFLFKPFKASQLMEVIDKALAGKPTQN